VRIVAPRNLFVQVTYEVKAREMERSGEIYDHTKSGQLRKRGRNRIKTETMMTYEVKARKEFPSRECFNVKVGLYRTRPRTRFAALV